MCPLPLSAVRDILSTEPTAVSVFLVLVLVTAAPAAAATAADAAADGAAAG